LLREHKELKERLADLGELTVYKTVRCALLQEGILTEADKAAVKEKIGTLYLNKKGDLELFEILENQGVLWATGGGELVGDDHVAAG
jgi:hypothetical protein